MMFVWSLCLSLCLLLHPKLAGGELVNSDSVGESSNRIADASFMWVIDNFEFWIHSSFQLRSPVFSITVNEKNYDFSIQIRETEKGILGLKVYYENTSDVQLIYLKMRVSLLGSDSTVLWSQNRYWGMKGVQLLTITENVNWSNFISMEKLFQLMDKQQDLPILVELKIPSPVKKGFQPKDSRDYVRSAISECQSFAELGSRLFNSSKHCDLYFKFSKNPFVKIPAHKLILDSRAPKLLTDAGALTTDGDKTIITVEDMTAPDFVEILKYIYTDIQPNDLQDRAKTFYEAAKKYGLRKLKTLCEQELFKTMSTESVINIILFAAKHDLGPLRDEALEYIRKNSNLMSQTKWLQLLNALLEALQCKASSSAVDTQLRHNFFGHLRSIGSNIIKDIKHIKPIG